MGQGFPPAPLRSGLDSIRQCDVVTGEPPKKKGKQMYLTFTGHMGQQVAVAPHLIVAVEECLETDGRPSGHVYLYLVDKEPFVVRGSVGEILVSISRQVDAEVPF